MRLLARFYSIWTGRHANPPRAPDTVRDRKVEVGKNPEISKGGGRRLAEVPDRANKSHENCLPRRNRCLIEIDRHDLAENPKQSQTKANHMVGSCETTDMKRRHPVKLNLLGQLVL